MRMRKILLMSTFLVPLWLTPGQARADPVTTIVALMANGATFGAALAATLGTVGAALAQLGLSLILSGAARALAGKPKSEQIRAELTRPTSLPAKRFVYGTGWAPGTPVGWQVKGSWLYICYLMNSRPSALTSHSVLFDKRSVTMTGDPFDFAGPGAASSNSWFEGHASYWIGRGDQTGCPTVISSETDYFEATDAWTGCTVLWCKLHCGASDRRQERWPSTPPAVNIEGDWSLVHDPRSDTFGPSSNQALIVRDALRMNPLRPYADAYLWDETFAWAADMADQLITNKDATTTPRYAANGVLVWAQGSELEDQIEPLLAAGGSRLIRAGGKLGLVPAVAREPIHTVDDFTDGQPIQLTRWQPGEDLYTECVASYTAPDRAYESAETPAFIVAGAQEADGGTVKRLDLQLDFVTDHRQAQRLAKIAVLRSRMQRAITGELFPDVFELVAGSVTAVDLPWPYGPWNGIYEVEQINPGAGMNDDQSITLRLPVMLRETSAAIYAWDAATEEKDVEGAEFDPWIGSLDPPTSITLFSGGDAALITDTGAITPRVGLSWQRSSGASATKYEWQWMTQYYRRTGGSEGTAEWVWPSEWAEGGLIDPDVGDGLSFTVHINPVNVGRPYRARVRAVGLYGNSDWVQPAAVTAAAPTRVLKLPEILLAIGGAGQVDLTLRQANDGFATIIELWAGAFNTIGTAALLAAIPAGSNVTVAATEEDLGPGVTRYYWLRARDSIGNASAFTASATATTS